MEAIRLHHASSRRQARERAIELLRLVGIASAETQVDAYPHELSGGMRQRVMIAMALACEPSLLIADEPTTALDVTIQAQILDLLASLRVKHNMAVLLITHDLGVVAEVATDVAVMYAGQIVESAPAARIFAAPRHPYTQGLLRSLPSFDVAPSPPGEPRKRPRLPVIEGIVPDLSADLSGCRFADRCPNATEDCRALEQSLAPLLSHPTHLVRCWRALADDSLTAAETACAPSPQPGA